MTIPLLVLAILVGYLFGSFAPGYFLVRIFRGEDIRSHGSGRTGATNVGRLMGTWAFIVTVLLDGIKALIGVLVVRAFISPQLAPDLRIWGESFAGVAAIIGHNWSIFLRFKGGAGTIACMGAAAVLWIWVLPIAAAIGFGALFISSMASVGSIVTVWSMFAVFLLRAIFFAGAWAHVFFALLAALIIMWALRPNIKRLRSGTERRIWFGLNRVRGNS